MGHYFLDTKDHYSGVCNVNIFRILEFWSCGNIRKILQINSEGKDEGRVKREAFSRKLKIYWDKDIKGEILTFILFIYSLLKDT